MSPQFLDLHVKCGSFSCKSGLLVAHSVRSQLTVSLLELKPKCGLCAQDNIRGASLSSIKHLLSTNAIGSFELFETKKMHLKMKVSCQWDGDVKMESIKVQNNTQRNVDKKHDLGESSADCSRKTSLPGIIYPPLRTVGKSTNIMWQECMVKKHDREKMLGQKGCVVWITGLSGSGKSTVACTLDHALLSKGRLSYVLDGDNLRHGLNKNLGFSGEDRAENIRRVGEVAKLFADAGVICIASFISPYRKDRDACREIMGPGDFIEVYLNIPLHICEQRDPKGLYKLARAGKIKGFTGVDDPYEEPSNCEIVLEPRDNVLASPEAMAGKIIAYLEKRGYLGS